MVVAVDDIQAKDAVGFGGWAACVCAAFDWSILVQVADPTTPSQEVYDDPQLEPVTLLLN